MNHPSLKYAKILLFFSVVIAIMSITAKQSIMAEIKNNKTAIRQQEQEIIKQLTKEQNSIVEQVPIEQVPIEQAPVEQDTLSRQQLAQEEFNKGNIDSAIAIYQDLLNQPNVNQEEIKQSLIKCYEQKGLTEEIDKLNQEEKTNLNENNLQ